MLVDSRTFVRRLLAVVGGKASFVLGMDIRKLRADYFMTVRLPRQPRWREWREVLMFGHGFEQGEYDGEEGLFMRVFVSRRWKTEEDINTFVKEMVRKCDTYEETCRYNEGGLFRVPKKRSKAVRTGDGDQCEV